MTLTQRFSICPHGVKRILVKETPVLCAVFKVIASIREFETSGNNAEITKEDWQNFVALVNDMVFQWEIDQANRILNVFIQPSGVVAQQKLNTFEFENTGDPVDGSNPPTREKTSTSFSLGVRNPYKKATDPLLYPMDAIETNDQGFRMMKDLIGTPQVIQYVDSLTHRNDENHRKFTAGFVQSNDFTRTKNSVVKKSNDTKYDFKQIYGTIINEPYLAERHFGLIREVLIPFDQLLKDANEFAYAIQITEFKQEPENMEGEFMVKSFGNGVKFYNGLKKMFFRTDEFKTAEFSLYDLYKAMDNSSPNANKHPEGIYLNVIYKTEITDGPITDPFTQVGVKGYNVIVKTDSFFSLSYHRRKFTFPHRFKSVEYKTSGMLTPRAETSTHNNVTIRNNVLFCWRGDNLLVNRPVKEKQTRDGMFSETKVTFDRDNYDNKYVYKELFIRVDDLVSHTQLQLTCGQAYYFFLRTVGYTEHCLPAKEELSADEREYTWTLEDELSDDATIVLNAITGKSIKLDIDQISNLPIRSFQIRGSKLHDDSNAGSVDTIENMVLNDIKGIFRERRFLFPPVIKLEDFKFLGYFSKNNLRRENEAAISEDHFIGRSVRLENLNKNKLGPIALSRHRVNFLADPRAVCLYLLPADYFTLANVPSYNTPDKVVVFTTQYPFFRDTRCLELKVEKEPGQSGLPDPTYSMALDDKSIYRSLRGGIYRFKLYATDKPSPADLKLYSAEKITVSLVNRPPGPVQQGDNLPSLREIKNGNYWYADLEIKENDCRKSIKYTEVTTVLQLGQDNLSERMRKYLGGSPDKPERMYNEYPYKMFLQNLGEIDSVTDFKTCIYPDYITLQMRVDPRFADDGIQIFSLKLNDRDILVGKTDGTTKRYLRLFLNGRSIFETQLSTVSEFSIFSLQFDKDRNQFILVIGGDLPNAEIIPNWINPDISINDLIISEDLLYSLSQRHPEFYIFFRKSGNYVLIENLQHPYSSAKKIRLFASSAFQGYFPDETLEYKIGSTGSVHDVIVFNNIEPEIPVLETSVLFMYTSDVYWHDRLTKHKKSVKTQFLIQLTLSEDFMKEGENKLGIIMSCSDTKDVNVSTVGEDITKLTDETAHTLEELLAFEKGQDLFLKYLDPETIEVQIEGLTYRVQQFIPYYNATLRKWQIILPLKNFGEAESIFFKFSTLKISPGYDSLTKYSKIAKPVILPVSNTRSFDVIRDKHSYDIKYHGPKTFKRKIFYVMLKKSSSNLKIQYGNDVLTDLHDIELLDTAVSSENHVPQKVLQFVSHDIRIKRVHCRSILILEFEALWNFGEIKNEPVFVDYNPLFDKPGLNLVSMGEFEASWI